MHRHWSSTCRQLSVSRYALPSWNALIFAGGKFRKVSIFKIVSIKIAKGQIERRGEFQRALLLVSVVGRSLSFLDAPRAGPFRLIAFSHSRSGVTKTASLGDSRLWASEDAAPPCCVAIIAGIVDGHPARCGDAPQPRACPVWRDLGGQLENGARQDFRRLSTSPACARRAAGAASNAGREGLPWSTRHVNIQPSSCLQVRRKHSLREMQIVH